MMATTKQTNNSQFKDLELRALFDEADKLASEAKTFLHANGKIYDTSKWVTVKEYVKRHGLESHHVVSNWIARGIVTEKDIRIFPELNNLRLIRDRQYVK